MDSVLSEPFSFDNSMLGAEGESFSSSTDAFSKAPKIPPKSNDSLLNELLRDLEAITGNSFGPSQVQPSSFAASPLNAERSGLRQNAVDASFSGELFEMAENRIVELTATNRKLLSDNVFLLEQVKKLENANSSLSKAPPSPSNSLKDSNMCEVNDNEPQSNAFPNVMPQSSESLNLAQSVKILRAENEALKKTIEKLKNSNLDSDINSMQDLDQNKFNSAEDRSLIYKKLTFLIEKLNGRRLEQDNLLDKYLEKCRVGEKSIEEQNQKISSLVNEVETSKDRVKKAQSIISALDNKIDDYLKANEALEKKHSSQSIELEESKKSIQFLKECQEQLQKQENILNNQISMQENEICRLSKHVDSLMNERSNLADMLKGAGEKIQSLMHEREKSSKTLNAEISHLNKENQKLQIHIQNLKSDVSSIGEAFESKCKEKESILAMHKDLMGKNELNLQKIYRLENDNALLKAKANDPSLSEGDMRRISSLEKDNLALKKDLIKREKQLQKVIDEKTVVLGELDSLRIKVASSESQKVSLNEQISKQSLEIVALKNSIKTHESEKLTLKDSLAKTENRALNLSEMNDQLSALNSQNQSLKQQLSSLEANCNSLKEEVSKKKSKESALNQKIMALRQEKDDLLLALENEKNNFMNVEKDVSEEKNKALLYEMQFQSSKTELAVLKDAIEKERNERIKAEQEVRKNSEREREMAINVNALQMENQSLRKTLSEFQKNIAANSPTKSSQLLNGKHQTPPSQTGNNLASSSKPVINGDYVEENASSAAQNALSALRSNFEETKKQLLTSATKLKSFSAENMEQNVFEKPAAAPKDANATQNFSSFNRNSFTEKTARLSNAQSIMFKELLQDTMSNLYNAKQNDSPISSVADPVFNVRTPTLSSGMSVETNQSTGNVFGNQ